MKITLKGLVSILIIVLFFSVGAFSQTTEFTYQGQLQSSSAPASGSFDFEFLLFDASAGGTQIGSTLTRNGVAVANGIFEVNLDFGGSFPGANRFLEIHVRQSGGGVFTTLTPRQSVTSAPYSVKSLTSDNATNAANATNATNATNAATANGLSASCVGCVTNAQIGSVDGAKVTGTVANATNATNATNSTTATNATQLGGVPASQYLQTNGNGSGLTNLNAASITTGTLSNARLGLIPTANIADGAVTAPKIASGQVVKGVTVGATTLTDNVTLAGSGNITVTPAGNTLTIASTSGGVGGSGTANTLPLWSNGTTLGNSLITQSGGNVGIGTIPTFKLDVLGSSSSIAVRGFASGPGIGVAGVALNQGGIGVISVGSGWFKGDTTPLNSENAGFGAGIVIGSSGNLGYIQAFDYSAFQAKILALNNSGGNVGIGTTAPTQTLDVDGTLRVRVILNAPPTGTLCTDSSNNVVRCGSSSLKWKTNVQSYHSGLDVINRLRPISFNWKDGGAKDIGLAAEEVAKVAPPFAYTNSKGEVEGVKYERLNILLINAVKEQQAQISLQQRQIDNQRKQIRGLTKIVCARKSKKGICRQ